jgi:hypothetical protein
MTNKQLRRYEMLFRVMKFGAARQDRFPESTRVGEAFAIVSTAVRHLEGRAVAQMLLKREGARARAAARAELQRLLESISRTASIIQANSPERPHAFEMPEKKSAQALLIAARATAQHLEPVAAQLVEHGLPQTVVADFTAALDAYAEAVGRREVGKSETAASRKAIETTLDAAASAARRLDVMVANLLSADGAALAEWERARRVGYSRRAAEPPADSTPVVVSPGEPPVAPADEPPATRPLPPVVDDAA